MSKATRITLIVSAVVLILGLAGLAVWSGAELDAEKIITAIISAGVGAAGALGLKGNPKT